MVVKKKAVKIEDDTEKVEKVNKKDYFEINVGGYVEKVRANPWIAATFALGIILILVLIFGGGAGASSKKISADEAGKKVVNFLNSNPAIDGEVTLVSTKQDGQFYEVTLSYQGQQVPVFTTLDGKFLVGNPIKLEETAVKNNDQQTPQVQADTSVPKSDRPVVELFVMSHCPFGTQIEKGILPVVNLLGDKIDFEIKFVNYAMHGEVEVLEQLNQYCIQMEQNDKYLNYLRCFLEDGDGTACLTKEKIDKAKLEACTQKTDKEFAIKDNLADKGKWLNGRFPQFNIHNEENEKYGVRGSPTLVINGKQANSGRDPASLLATICNAFNNAPAECNNKLSSATPSPGFGWSATSGDSAAAAQCG